MITAVYDAEDFPHASLITSTLREHTLTLPEDYAGTSQDPSLVLVFNAALRLGRVHVLTDRTYDADLPEFYRHAHRYGWIDNEEYPDFKRILNRGNKLPTLLNDTAWWHYLCAIELAYQYNPKAPGSRPHNTLGNIFGQYTWLPAENRLCDLNKLDALHQLQTHLWTHFTNISDDSSFNSGVLALAVQFTTPEILELMTNFQPAEISLLGRTRHAFGTASLAETLQLVNTTHPVLLKEMLPRSFYLDVHRTVRYPDTNYIPGIPRGLAHAVTATSAS